MEGSPLGSAFGDASGRTKGRKSFLLIAIAAALGLGGTVLAANITISGNNQVEFGQGVATTAPCANEIDVNPTSTYDSAGNKFYLDTVVVNIDNESDQKSCHGVNFTVSVFKSGTATPLAETARAYSSHTPIPTYSIRNEAGELFLDTNDVDRITLETNLVSE